MEDSRLDPDGAKRWHGDKAVQRVEGVVAGRGCSSWAGSSPILTNVKK
jgi:hypothetical protein